MMDYLTKHQKLNVIGKIVMLALLGLFVLVVTLLYLNSAFGWFAQNEDVSGDGMAVTAYQDDAEAEYTHYTFDAKNNQAVVYDQISDIQVPQYDLIFLQRNRYTPAVVRVALTGEHDLPESGTISLTVGRNLAATIMTPTGAESNDSELAELNDLFSSLMRLTIVKGAGIYSANQTTLYNNIDNLPYGNNSTLYSVIKDQTANNSTTNVFTTITGAENAADRYTKVNSLTLSIAYDENDWNGDTLNIYLYITYDKTLLNEYTRQDLSLSGDITSVGKVIELTNDLLTITASHS